MTIGMNRFAGIASLVIFSLIIHLFLLDHSPVLGGDQTWYILLGKAIASGQGYHSIWMPQSPEHSKFPFFYPVVLAIPIGIAGYNFFLLRFVNLSCFILSLVLFYIYTSRRSNRDTAIAVTTLMAFSCALYPSLSHMFSEMLYLMLSLCVLVMIEPFFERKERFLFFCSIVLMASAFFTRLVGLSLILGMSVFAFIHRSRWIVFLCTAFLCAGAWAAWVAYGRIQGAGDDYLSLMQALNPQTIKTLVPMMARNFYALFIYSIPYGLTGIIFEQRTMIALVLDAIAVAGFLYILKQKQRPGEYYVMTHLFCLLFLPWTAENPRYIIPLVPFLLFYFLVGMLSLGRCLIKNQAKNILLRYVICAGVLIYGFGNFYTAVLSGDGSRFPYQQNEETVDDFMACADWLRNESTPEATILSYNPPDIYLYAQRKGIAPHPQHQRIEEIVNDPRLDQCNYLMLPVSDHLEILLSKSPRLKEVFRKGGNIIIEVTHA